MNESPVRWRVVFHGRVQGVGFRQTCCDYACPHRIKGWVRNRDNGTVELVGEGSESNLTQFVNDVRHHTFGEVRDSQVTVQDATGEFSSFTVRS